MQVLCNRALVLSATRRSVGRVGENPENEVVKISEEDVKEKDGGTYRDNAGGMHPGYQSQFFSCIRRLSSTRNSENLT